MKKVLTSLAVVIVVVMGQCPLLAADINESAVVNTPPVINMPAGGKITTEINFSDSDVLGLIKAMIPATIDTVKSVISNEGTAQLAKHAGPQFQVAAKIAEQVDVKGLMEAVDGVKNIRVIVARYPKTVQPVDFLNDFNKGIAKLGEFSKIISNIDEYDGVIAVYAQPNNAGYIGVAYELSSHTAYAARIVGFVDLPKLVQWAGSVAKAVIPAFTTGQVSPSVPATVPGSAEN